MAFRFGAHFARRLLAGVAVASVSFLASACGDGGSESEGDTYPLVTVNGETLPYEDGFGGTIKSGSVSLLSGGRFSFRIAGSFSDPEFGSGNFSATHSGTYEYDEASGIITFTATRSCYSDPDGSACDDYADTPEIVEGTKDETSISATDPDTGYSMVFQKAAAN